MDKHTINPDIKLQNAQPVLDIPNQGWNLLEKSNIAMSFTHGHMIAYFVDRKASDNLPARDIKSISDQAYALSERGHIQNIELATDFGTNYIRAKCLPEMKKTIIYSLRMVLKDDCSIVGVVCGCPAGKGPAASCKHIAEA